MRKNRMMRLASGMLVLTIATTCAISGTFAKYTTSAEGSDSARVAYWGFNASSIEMSNLFTTSYKAGTETNDEDKNKGIIPTAENTKVANNGATVISTEKVIAPGTTNSATFGFTYTGYSDSTKNTSIAAPEVAYNFTVSTEGSSCADDIKNNKNIVWSLDGTDYTSDTTSTSWDKLLEAIAKLSGADSVTVDSTDKNKVTATKKYDPNKLPTAFYGEDSNASASKTHTVSWKWNFEDSANANKYDDNKTQDKFDTAMGNKITLDEVTLKITVTATQVD